jgi:hypothetical protein
MPFFNKKEDVINIELTSYGKKLLAEGKFNPTSYSFEDDTVYYDANFVKTTEDQNCIQDRIQENVSLQTFNALGIETNILKNKKLHGYQQMNQYNEDYHLSLGNSAINSLYVPAWDVKVLYGEIGEIVTYITGSTTFLNVPQLSSSIIYKTHIEQGITPELGAEIDAPRLLDVGVEKIYPDGSFIDMEEDFLLLEIDELNTDFEKENFEIEVFQEKILNDSRASGSFTELIPLSFVHNNYDIPIEDRPLLSEMNIDSTYVDYFFEVLTDEEIPEDIICKYIYDKRKKGVYTDKLGTQCEIKKKEASDTYITDIFDDEDCE